MLLPAECATTRAIRREKLYSPAPAWTSPHAPRPVPCCNAADPISPAQVEVIKARCGRRPDYDYPLTIPRWEEPADNFGGEKWALSDKQPYGAWTYEPPAKKVVLIEKSGPAFDIPASLFTERAALSNTPAAVGSTSAGRDAYMR